MNPLDHLPVLPIVIPLVAGALVAATGGYGRGLARAIGLLGALAHLWAVLALASRVNAGEHLVYALSNWPAPFGIVMVADRLAALMLVLTSTMSLVGLVYANAAWNDRGRRFQAFWQLQVMGLSGAFLTGDLFNLFVFFEVLLAASYALLLHGGGRARVGSTFHFVVINLTASSVFLIAVSLLYSITGTLNMAHLALRIAQLPATDVPLATACAMLLLGVFAIKSGLFPFHFWVPASYGSAAAPVVALVVAKIGAYVIIRVFPLLFGATALDFGGAAAALAGIARPWLIGMALLTLGIGAAGALACRTLRQLAATLTLVSIGTLFLPLALGSVQSLAAAGFYLVHSTLATAVLFLVAEWVGVQRGALGDRLEPGPALRNPFLIGTALVWAAVNSVGLPPTAGFISKVLVLRSLDGISGAPWYWGAILASSFCTLIAVSRALSLLLWNVAPAGGGSAWVGGFAHLESPTTNGGLRQTGAVLATIAALAASVAIVFGAGPLKAYTDRIAEQLAAPHAYLDAVLGPARELQPWIRPSPANPMPRGAQ